MSHSEMSQSSLEPLLGGQVLSSTAPAHKIKLLGTLPQIPRIPQIPSDPADPADPAEVVAASPPRTLPSTRAGGQDDVSYTNSLK